jgi:hypothetical protein
MMCHLHHRIRPGATKNTREALIDLYEFKESECNTENEFELILVLFQIHSSLKHTTIL